MTKIVVPVKSFTRSDIKEPVTPRTAPFEVDDGYAQALIRNGLVIETKMAPKPEVKAHANGAPLSASPAAPVSPKRTYKRSSTGKRKTRKTTASS